MKVILITGASSGMGKEFAIQMDPYFSSVDEFWLVARREEELENLKAQLQHQVRCFPMDITKESELQFLEKALRETKAKLCMLVNCAGYGLMGDFMNQCREDMLGMIRLNCEALTSVTHRMLPYMVRNSRIIQLASSAAFLPQADFAVYAATKSYVFSFSKALGMELKKRGIFVTAVCPGPVDTPFFDIAEKTGTTLKLKKYTMVSAKEVVLLALRDSYYKRSVSVCSFPMRSFAVFAKVFPQDGMLWGAEMMKCLEQKRSERKIEVKQNVF